MGVGFDDILFWPFAVAFAGVIAFVAVVVLLFWLWMLIDCARRKFRNNVEKIIWIVVIALSTWFGALIYFIVVRSLNPRGLAER